MEKGHWPSFIVFFPSPHQKKSSCFFYVFIVMQLGSNELISSQVFCVFVYVCVYTVKHTHSASLSHTLSVDIQPAGQTQLKAQGIVGEKMADLCSLFILFGDIFCDVNSDDDTDALSDQNDGRIENISCLLLLINAIQTFNVTTKCMCL